MSKSIGVVFFTTILLSALSITLSEANYDKYVPDPLIDVLNKYENPIFNATNKIDTNRRILVKRSPKLLNNYISNKIGKIETQRSYENSDIRDTIREKVKQLAPMLDDAKTGERTDEEVLKAQDILKIKYKTLRKDVEKLLRLEPISNNTKLSVIEALDQIESEVKDNGCAFKKIKENVMRRKYSQALEPSIVIPKHLGHDELNDIQEKWDKVVHQYSMEGFNNNNDSAKRVAFLFLTRLRQFVFDIHEDYKKLQERFKIKCNIDRKANFPIFKQSLTNGKELEQDDTCNDISICSLELLHFLADFYKQLNETYSETIENYIGMYVAEVNAEDTEKESFKDILNLTLRHGRKLIQTMFTKELENFKNILNVTSRRPDGLKTFIDRTVNNTKEIIYTSLTLQLKKLKPQLRYTVKQDITTLAGIELGNLQNIYKDKMCFVFKTCNGDDLRKRKNKIRFKSFDPHNIKIKLRMDKPKRRNLYEKNYGREKNILESNKVSARKLNNVKYFNISEYNPKIKTVNVTRTTYAEYIEKGTTKSMGNSSQMPENITMTAYAKYTEEGTTKLDNSSQTVEDVTQPLVIYF